MSGGQGSTLTVRAARDRFFADNDFGVDGGYDDRWADAQLGPFAYRVPNLRARARALRVHDLHHLVTGYPTDWRGEAQISAWELGSGWGRYPYAWIIAIFGLLTGLVAAPVATWRAFVRGRRSANLYARRDVEAILDQPLDALARELHVPAAGAPVHARACDAFELAGLAILAAGFGLVALPFLAAFVTAGELRRAGGCPLGALGLTRSCPA